MAINSADGFGKNWLDLHTIALWGQIPCVLSSAHLIDNTTPLFSFLAVEAKKVAARSGPLMLGKGAVPAA